jgi:adenine-specific DNA-methyltransferase
VATRRAESYRHGEETPLRPDVGTQAQFKKKKAPKTYRYDSSLSPALDWDGQNPARERGEELIREILDAETLDDARAAAAELARLSQPYLDWAGKAEGLSFDVPTLPLFVHERLSTKAILETLRGHERDRQMELQLFADPQLPLHQQLEAYEHPGKWTNRLILGDSLVVMNSLYGYEGLGGQVQMIYIDPPYGVKFGSNFQPFVRKRDVKNNDDADMTREPEMVKAYRDTWELGLHSYLTYLRDRLKVARDLLTPSGSVFVQIGDENVHHVREVMDEVFGGDNFVSEISFRTTPGQTADVMAGVVDHVLWYALDADRAKAVPLFRDRDEREQANLYGATDQLGRRCGYASLASASSSATTSFAFTLEGTTYSPPSGRGWRTNREGMERLIAAGRIHGTGKTAHFLRYPSDFEVTALTNLWHDVMESTFAVQRWYVVQTPRKVIERCILMTTDPGDLVLDPTCGSGTTAYVAEQWGRRWITIDTSRVPLALARQRILTATFPYYALQDPGRGPAGGFVYRRRQNAKGDEVGGIVPHVTLKSIAKDEPPAEEVLVDRPEVDSKITRVSGPFVFEATIPTPVDIDGDGTEDSGAPHDEGYVDRMLEALRRNPLLQLGGNSSLTLRNVKRPARSLYLSAEASFDPGSAPAAIVFGPENGAISEKLIYEAVTEAHMKGFEHLLLIGFAIEPNAREFVGKAEQMVGIPVTYVQATPDLVLGDLLKTMRSSQLFSVAGLPDVAIRRVARNGSDEHARYEVELLGLDTFDPSTFEVRHRAGDDVPAWFLDTDWNELSFHVSQAFFPRTGAWENLKRALKGEYDDSVWDHLAGTTSAPFQAGEHGQIAVKVIDDRGNELLVVKNLDEAS